ncbi:hypothetical protein TWF281_004895 [Arthrobotrys megalospora]
MISKLGTARALGLVHLFSSLASGFTIGVYDKAKVAAQGVGKTNPDWILCHPKKGGRWSLYAADIATGCDYTNDGDAADQWTFYIPGNRHLDIGEEISRFYLTGTNSEVIPAKAPGAGNSKPVITYDSNIQNTFFSYGYYDGHYVEAPFTLVRNGKNTALSDKTAAKNGDILDFVGISGTKDDQRALRLQSFGGQGSYWHIGRGSALPLTKGTPAVEFRIIADPKQNKAPSTSIFSKFEEEKNEGTNLDYIDNDEYKIYESMFPEQGKLGTISGIGKGLFGKLTSSIGKAGGKVAGGIKNYLTKPKDVEEEIIEDDFIGASDTGPTFERFDIETIRGPTEKKGGKRR